MHYDRIIRTGVIGTLITAVCCFTPLLVGAFAAAGMTAVLSWVDIALLPVLGLFLGILFFGLAGKARAKKAGEAEAPPANPETDS